MQPCTVIRAVTPQHLAQVRAIRQQVFIDEQGIPAELEWDGRDAACLHVLACTADDSPVGTGRLDRDGRIGRMAVLAPWRGRGIGTALLAELLAVAREHGYRRVYLHAQESAQPFYRSAGFRSLRETCMEAGIRHVAMEMCLADGNT